MMAENNWRYSHINPLFPSGTKRFYTEWGTLVIFRKKGVKIICNSDKNICLRKLPITKFN